MLLFLQLYKVWSGNQKMFLANAEREVISHAELHVSLSFTNKIASHTIVENKRKISESRNLSPALSATSNL